MALAATVVEEAALTSPSIAPSTATAEPRVNAIGDLYVADFYGHQVVKVPPIGFRSSMDFFYPSGVAIDAVGNLFVAEGAFEFATKVTPDGDRSWIDPGVGYLEGVELDGWGNLYAIARVDDAVVKMAPDGTRSRIGTGLAYPSAAAVDPLGNVFIADTDNNRIVKVAPDGSQSTVVTDHYRPMDLAVDAMSNLYFSGHGGAVVKLAPDGTRSTAATGVAGGAGLAIDAFGNLIVGEDYSDPTTYDRVIKVDRNGVQSTLAMGFHSISDVTVYAPAPVFTAASPPDTATIGRPYSYTYTASVLEGAPAPAYAVVVGALPPGLALDAATGDLSGTPTAAGTFTFTVQTMNAANANLAAPVTITVRAPLNADEAYVTALYRDFMGRTPDPSGLDYWVGLVAGGWSHATVSGLVAGSPEALRFFVAKQYQEILGRTPDPSGLAYWVGRIAGHELSATTVTVMLYASAEFVADVGGTDPAWIRALYTHVLSRTAMEPETTYWTDFTRQHDRLAAAGAIVSSAEAGSITVHAWYTSMLGRSPDTSEMASMQALLDHGGTLAVAIAISATDEYTANASRRFG